MRPLFVSSSRLISHALAVHSLRVLLSRILISHYCRSTVPNLLMRTLPLRSACLTWRLVPPCQGTLSRSVQVTCSALCPFGLTCQQLARCNDAWTCFEPNLHSFFPVYFSIGTTFEIWPVFRCAHGVTMRFCHCGIALSPDPSWVASHCLAGAQHSTFVLLAQGNWRPMNPNDGARNVNIPSWISLSDMWYLRQYQLTKQSDILTSSNSQLRHKLHTMLSCTSLAALAHWHRRSGTVAPVPVLSVLVLLAHPSSRPMSSVAIAPSKYPRSPHVIGG